MLTALWLSQKYLRNRQKEKIISLTALISVLGVTIGVAVLIVVIAVMSGFDRYLEEKMVGANAHLFLESPQGLSHPQALIEELEKLPHVLAAAPFVAGSAFLKEGKQITAVLDLRGIDPELQPKVSKIREYLRQGRFQVEANEVILGEELASRLGIGLNGVVALISPVTLQPTNFKVGGIFKSGMYLYDTSLILTSIKTAQEFLRMPGLVSGIALKADSLYRAEMLKEEVYKKIDHAYSYEVRTWVDENRNFLNALKLEKIVMFIVVVMTTVVAAFGIISTLMMSVMNKIRDIGILRSCGAKAKTILEIFIFQGLGIGLSGIILGLFTGVAMALSLNKIVDFISMLIGRPLIPRDIYYFERIPTYFNVLDIALIVLAALVISLAASIYPAYYAVKINPAAAIRHE